ncbi:MAG: glycogen-binding domain-containing protein [Pseudomonadota bacterium]
MRITLLMVGLLALAGCDDGGGCLQPSGAGPDAANTDTIPRDGRGDGMNPGDASPDTGVLNTAPTFGPLPPVSLDMGTHTTLALAELMGDAEDPDGDLVLSWSAENVALHDGPGHALMIVAPVDWWGIETIGITLSDTGGLEAAAEIVVTVSEVIPTVDPPPQTCGEVVFSYAAPGAQLVALAGGFNDWTPEPMADGDGDGTWELTMILEPGSWEYKFVADGTWETDPANPNKVSDGFGGHNSLLEIPSCPAE